MSARLTWRLLLPALLFLLAPRLGAAERTVTVFAASSLTDAFTALQPEFERAHQEWKVAYEFGASSTLRTQIQQGAPADVFASADQEQMQALVTAKGTPIMPLPPPLPIPARNR